MDEALTGLILKAASHLTISAIRTHLSRDPSVVDSAIENTDTQFPGAEPALRRWVSTQSFERVLARIASGDHEVIDDATIRSFLDEGDYYVPDSTEALETARPIVTTLLGAVLTGLLEGDQGTPVLANRMDRRFDEVMAELRRIDAAQSGNAHAGASVSLARSTEDGETPPDPSNAARTAQIDAANDLFNQGKVVTARALLRHIRTSTDEIPEALEFRLLTGLGACALAADDIDEAVEVIEAAYALQPKNPTALANAAAAAGMRGEHQRAAKMARESLELQPHDAHAASVLMAALHGARETEELERLIAEDWVVEDRQSALPLVRIWINQHRFDDARELAEHLVEEDATDYEAHLALAGCHLAASEAGHQGNTVVRAKEIEGHATQALDLLRDTELTVLRLQAWSIRVGAHLLLGATEAAMTDTEAMLAADPGNVGALYNKGLILLSTGRHSDARAILSDIDDSTMRERALLPLAEACRYDEKLDEAAALLQGSFSLDAPGWDDIRRAEMLCEVEADLRVEDSVGPLLSAARELRPNDADLLVLEATHHGVRNRLDDAEKSLVSALDCALARDRHEVQSRLADLYGQHERYSEAADLYKEIVSNDVLHPGAMALLSCLRSSRRLREALDWARRIRVEHPRPHKFALETEAQILNQVGDVSNAAERWNEVCSRADAAATDHLQRAQALLWAGDRLAAAERVREVHSSDLADEPRRLLNLAQLKYLLGEPEYLDDAYTARRRGVDDPSTHSGYFALFMSLDAEMTTPAVVEPGCAVLLRSESGDQWWFVTERDEVPRGDHDLRPDTSLAKALLGRSPGETVVLQEGVGARLSEVVEIQNKYVRALQETAAEFPTRFPRNADLMRISVKPDDFAELLGIIDEADRLSRDLMRLYRDTHVPFASLCQRLARPVPDIWRACTASDDIRIRFGSGAVHEAEESAEALRDCDAITLDMISLLTMHALGLVEHLHSRFARVSVPQQVLDSLRAWVYEATLGRRHQATLGRNIDGTYTYIEMTDDAWSERQDYARSVLDLAESLEPVPAYPLLDADQSLIEIMEVVLTPDAVGAVFAGDEGDGDRPVLVSDDLAIAELARVRGVRGVNTQAVLRDLRRANVLTDEEYSSLIGRLAQLNYRFIQVGADDILTLLEANGFRTNEATRALFLTLQGPEGVHEAAVSVVADLIAGIARASIDRAQESVLITTLLTHLHSGRRLSNALEECRSAIASRFALASPTSERVLATVDMFIRVHVG